MVPGRLVLINGSPSVGKTTLVREILRRLDDPWFHHNLDRHQLGYDDRHRNADLWEQAVAGYEVCLQAMLDAGHDVISEAVLPSGNPNAFIAVFGRYKPYVIALRCDLAEVHRRESERERHIGHYYVTALEHEAIQAFDRYDLRLDSTSRSAADLALEAVEHLVASTFRGHGFDDESRPQGRRGCTHPNGE